MSKKKINALTARIHALEKMIGRLFGAEDKPAKPEKAKTKSKVKSSGKAGKIGRTAKPKSGPAVQNPASAKKAGKKAKSRGARGKQPAMTAPPEI